MAKRFELLEGETIIIHEPVHWKNYIGPATVALFGAIGVILRMKYPHVSIAGKLVGKDFIDADFQSFLSFSEGLVLSVLTAFAYLRVLQTAYIRYYVTNKRIISVSGIIAITFSEMLISRCEMVFLHQGVAERIFDSGDILCVSAGASIKLDDVFHAVRFKQTILAEMNSIRSDIERKTEI